MAIARTQQLTIVEVNILCSGIVLPSYSQEHTSLLPYRQYQTKSLYNPQMSLISFSYLLSIVLLYLHFHSESNELSANIPHNVQNELYKKVPALYAQNLSSLCQTSMVLLKQPPHELESVLQVL